MFDDRLFDVIMGEMMDTFGQEVRTDEGSLAYNACAKIAEKLEEVYGDMDALSDNMLPDTQDLAHLIRYAGERGISYRYATAPVARGRFRQEIELGEQFICNDYTYTVTELIEGYDFRLECETEGTEANTNFGELEPVDYVDEYLGGELTELLVAGTDDEDEERFRQRVLESFHSEAFGGNKADYRQYIDDIAGVGGCKPERRAADSPWVIVTVISSEYDVPSDDLIGQIQTAVDPEQNHGEGDGMAPICHNVLIKPVEAVPVNVEAAVTLDTGYTAEECKTQIAEAIEGYLKELREAWESNEHNSTVVRVSRAESHILTVEGVLDITDTTLNGSDGNLVLTYTQIPTLGEVTLNV